MTQLLKLVVSQDWAARGHGCLPLACDRGMRISTAESEPTRPTAATSALYGEALILNNTGTSAIPRPKKKKSPTNAEVYAMERYFISQ